MPWGEAVAVGRCGGTDEEETQRRALTVVCPTGLASVVTDACRGARRRMEVWVGNVVMSEGKWRGVRENNRKG